MEIKLTHAESEEIFHTALCDGIALMRNYGLELDWNVEDYKIAKDNLIANEFIDKVICREDVWLKILKMGSKLTLVDEEMDGLYTRSIDIHDLHARVEKAPIKDVMNMLEGVGDASTADIIIQSVFFEEVIFG